MLLQDGLHGLELREVLAHVRVQHHLDQQVAHVAEVLLLHVREHVAVVLLEGPGREEDGRSQESVKILYIPGQIGRQTPGNQPRFPVPKKAGAELVILHPDTNVGGRQ